MIEYEDCSVNRLCCKITFECLVNGDTVDIGIIDKPNYLITKQF